MQRIFSVAHGDTIIPVVLDTDDDVQDAAIQAAASAALTMKQRPFVVYDPSGFVASFSQEDIDEWWA